MAPGTVGCLALETWCGLFVVSLHSNLTAVLVLLTSPAVYTPQTSNRTPAPLWNKIKAVGVFTLNVLSDHRRARHWLWKVAARLESALVSTFSHDVFEWLGCHQVRLLLCCSCLASWFSLQLRDAVRIPLVLLSVSSICTFAGGFCRWLKLFTPQSNKCICSAAIISKTEICAKSSQRTNAHLASPAASSGCSSDCITAMQQILNNLMHFGVACFAVWRPYPQYRTVWLLNKSLTTSYNK